MKRKRPSPPVSENEFDISGAIADASLEDDASNVDFAQPVANSRRTGFSSIHEVENESDGDEAFIAASQAASNRKSINLKGRTVKKGGGFQAMGLNAHLLKAITRKGFSVPTPIQRKTIPLIMEGTDVVGMARTGSGKTAAFVIPMIEQLKTHSARVGSRAVILSPSRELALQTLKVVKDMGRGTDLRSVLLVGGDSLEDQFSAMTSNPDVIIATPGRFHHLKVEMKLDLSSIRYVVFDEADRLFEMGFAVQLTEILHGLPTNRQTLLFSATLPKSLVEFARAGLQEPKLVRLDAETKISPDLQNAFFLVKSAEKEGALLQLIQDVVEIPVGPSRRTQDPEEEGSGRRKSHKRVTGSSGNVDSPTNYSTIVFAATKHHVEYLTALLKLVGYTVSYVYGSLDQTARKMQVQAFRDGVSNILVVTDVAARGIDIPVLANVINFDFPSQPKIYVHRVGRTARAGRKGWSYSLLQDADLPYLLDLQLFLSKRLAIGRSTDHVSYSRDMVLGTLPHSSLGSNCEWVAKMLDENVDLDTLRSVATKGEKLYTKTRNSASTESVKRAKEVQFHPSVGGLSPLFEDEGNGVAAGREDLLSRLRRFRPMETVFEVGKRGTTDKTVDVLRKARNRIDRHKPQTDDRAEQSLPAGNPRSSKASEIQPERPKDPGWKANGNPDLDMNSASDSELEITFAQGPTRNEHNPEPWLHNEHFIAYTPRSSNVAENRAYGVQSGSTSNAKRGSDFITQANDASMDLFNDDLKGLGVANQPRMRWDKKSKKYVNRTNDEDGSRGAKMVRGESGLKIAASLRSGRFEAWKKSNAIERLPQVGEAEKGNRTDTNLGHGRRYRHKAENAPKEADKFRDNYHTQKKRVAEAKANRVGKFRDGTGKNELRNMDAIRKARKLKERLRQRNGRPSKNGR